MSSSSMAQPVHGDQISPNNCDISSTGEIRFKIQNAKNEGEHYFFSEEDCCGRYWGGLIMCHVI